jgi:hypothetical protein
VQKDVNAVRVDVINEIITANLLAPVLAVTTLKTIFQPERVIKVAVSASLTATVVAVQVSIASTSDRTHGDTVRIELSVDLVAGSRALKLSLILDGVGDDVDLDLVIREAIVAVEPLEPLLVLSVVGGGDLSSLGLRNGCVGVPSNTNVEVTLVSHDLVETSVDVGIDAPIVGLLVMFPDLLERSLQVRRWVPARLALDRTISRNVREAALALRFGEKRLPDRTVEIGLSTGRGDNATEDGSDSRDTHVYDFERVENESNC